MGFFGRVANLVKGGVKVATRRAPDDDRAAALDAELRARAATPRPSAPPPAPEPAAPDRAEPAAPSAPAERDGEGNVKRRL